MSERERTRMNDGAGNDKMRLFRLAQIADSRATDRSSLSPVRSRAMSRKEKHHSSLDNPVDIYAMITMNRGLLFFLKL